MEERSLMENGNEGLTKNWRNCSRKIYGGKKLNGEWERRTNKELEELFDEPNIVAVAKGQRIRWLGHMWRMPATRIPKRVWDHKLAGNRRRGRPKRRWREEVQRDLNLIGLRAWKRRAADKTFIKKYEL
ncbi:hypothetical protein QE152_g6156 [Popillia japonica]|uniref:Endonuclease-reverse transcriptase n=1 Tax=Popillia japonica TaxID=7064 RepID=A0AAW1MF99_POPJA